MAKSLTSLSLVSLMSLVNSGATIESICNDYGCTEQEFRKRLDEICTRKSTIDSILSDIEKNEKKAGKGKDSDKSDSKDEGSAPSGSSSSRNGNGFSAGASSGMSGMSKPSLTKTKVSSPEVDNLLSQEASLAMQISSLETKANELMSAHYANIKEMREREEAVETARKTMEAAKRELDKQQELYDESVKTDEKLTEEIASVKVSQQVAEKDLADTRTQIYELTHASIMVLADGTITQTSGKTKLDMDDSGSDVLFNDLSEREDYEDLPVKKVRILARLFKIVENTNLELQVECEDSDINRAFHQANMSR